MLIAKPETVVVSKYIKTTATPHNMNSHKKVSSSAIFSCPDLPNCPDPTAEWILLQKFAKSSSGERNSFKHYSVNR